MTATQLFDLIAENWPGELTETGERELRAAIADFERTVRASVTPVTTFTGPGCELCGSLSCRGGCWK